MSLESTTFRISALANFAAAYNLAITGHVLVLLDLAGNGASEKQSSAVASAALTGAVCGQFFFGSMANRIGIETGLALSLSLCIVGNLIGALGAWHVYIFPVLILSRFIAGFGSGGVYPLSAVATAESSQDETSRGKRMMLAFSFQGLAQVFVPLSVVALDKILPYSPNAAWRIALLIGSIPPGFAIPMAINLSDLRPVGFADEGLLETRLSLQPKNRFTKRNVFLLLGTAGSWFLFDVVFYGNVIFTPFMLEEVFSNIDLKDNRLRLAEFSTIIYLVALPGVYLASFYADYLGRKIIQIIGFSICFLIFAGLTVFYEMFSTTFVFSLYLMTFFFYNFGPNATTFCLPAETFAKEDRSFFNGISAASGKLGAVIGASMFKVVLDSEGLRFTFLLCSCMCLVGTLFTIYFVKDQRGKSLDAIEEENQYHEEFDELYQESDQDDVTFNKLETIETGSHGSNQSSLSSIDRLKSE